jgi:hypothetical protein
MKATGVLTALLVFAAASVSATPVTAFASCAANVCVITPVAGNVALDPLDFALEVDWSPQHIKLIEPVDDRVEVRMSLLFDVTGSVSDLFETVPADGLTLNEMGGVEILGLNENFDDVSSFNPVLRINFDIFGPDTGSMFLVHGFDLAMSSMVPIDGTFDSFAFREARLTAIQGTAEAGIWRVPEPGISLLLGVGVLVAGFARSRARSRSRTTAPH